MRNLHRRFVLCSNGQIYGGDFTKFCGVLRILYELYKFQSQVKLFSSLLWLSFGMCQMWYFSQYCTLCLALFRASWYIPKPSLKIGSVNKAGCFEIEASSLLAWLFRNKTFFVFQDRKLKLSASVWKKNCETLQNFNSIGQRIAKMKINVAEWVELLWDFTKYFFKQMLKISTFYLENQKSFFPKKLYDLSRSL